MAVTVSEVRQYLLRLIEEVDDDQVAVEIIPPRGTAFLVRAVEYRSLKETAYLMQSSENARRLRESMDEVAAGSVESHELVE